MNRARPRPGIRSFTLVEVLTATAVLSILFSIMFGILQQTSKGWQAANRRVEASQVARLALDQIGSDLENCVAITAGNLPVPGRDGATTNYAFGFVHADRPNFQTDVVATDSLPQSGVNISMPNDYIFVVTPYGPSISMGTGDLCEVGYVPVYVVRALGYSSVRQGRYVLLRHLPLRFSTTNTTVANAQQVSDFLVNSSSWFLTPKLRDGLNPQTDGVPRNFFPIVDNLIAFNVDFLHRNPAGTGLLVSSNWGRPTLQGTNATWQGNPTGATGLPLAADITLCIFDEKAAERLMRIPGRGVNRALDLSEKQAVSQTPVDWSRVTADVRSTLQESVMTLKRRVFFKNAQP